MILEEGADLVLAGSSIEGNKATAEGGGISIIRGTVVVKLSDIINNKASEGSGIWRLDSHLYCERASISGNYPGNVYPPYNIQSKSGC